MNPRLMAYVAKALEALKHAVGLQPDAYQTATTEFHKNRRDCGAFGKCHTLPLARFK